MKNCSICLLFLFLIFSSGCNNSKSQNDEPAFAVYKGATLFDGTGKEIDNSIIIIKDGKIEAVGDENTPIPDDAEIIEVGDKYITPGLIDSHVHLGQTGFFDTFPIVDLTDSLSVLEAKAYQQTNPERYFEAYLRSGITGIYDVGGPLWTLQLQRSAEKNVNAPNVAAAGPLLTILPQNLLNTPIEKELVHLASDSLGRKMVENNSYLGSTGIKILALDPENEEYMRKIKAVADEAKKRENKLIAHAGTMKEAKAALRIGAKMLVHGVRDKVVDDEFVSLMNEKEAIYTSTLIVRDGHINSMKGLLGEEIEIRDPKGVVDKKTKSLYRGAGGYTELIDTTQVRNEINRRIAAMEKEDNFLAANLNKVYNAGIPVAVGTDAGNPGVLHGISIYDELEKMQEAGIPPSDLIMMATRNGAMSMERLDDIGTLEKGKMADLIILDKDPSEDISNMRSITHVMRGGFLRPVNEKFDQ